MSQLSQVKKQIDLELRCNSPFDFEKTFYKNISINWFWLTPYEIFSRKNIIWTGVGILNDMPIGLYFEFLGRVDNMKINVKIFCEKELSNKDINEIERIIKTALDLEKDLDEFYELAENYPSLKKSIIELYGMRITVNPSMLDSILRTYLKFGYYEKIRSIYRNYGELIEFDGRKIFISPSPEKIVTRGILELKDKCKINYQTANRIIYNSKLIMNSKIPKYTLELKKMSLKDAKKIIEEVKGINKSLLLYPIHPLFPVNSDNVKFFAKVLGLGEVNDTRRLIQVVKNFAEKNFGEWQSYAYEYLINNIEGFYEEFVKNFTVQ
jgi:hypothetical protein